MVRRLIYQTEEANNYCRERGINNIHELLNTKHEIPNKPVTGLIYHLGRRFLISVYYTAGDDAMAPAPGELLL